MRGLLRPLVASVSFLFAAALVGCGGGGGGATSAAPPSSPITPVPATATPSPTPAPTSASSTVTVGSSATAAPLPSFGGFGGTISFPAATSGSGSLTLTSALTPPAGAPTLSSALRHPLAVGTTTSLLYLAIGSASAVNFGSTFGFTIVLPSAASSTTGYYLAVYSSSSASAGYQPALGPASVSGSTLTFAAANNPVQFAAGQTYVFALYTGTLATPTPSASPTPSPSPSPTASPTPSGPTPTPSPSPTPTKSPTPAPTLAPNVGAMTVNSSTNVSGVINPGSTQAVVIGASQNTAIIGTTRGNSVGQASVSVTLGATSTSAVARRVNLGYIENPSGAELPLPEAAPAQGPEHDRMVRASLQVAPRGTIFQGERRTKALPTTVGSTAGLWASNFAIGSSSGSYQQVNATLTAVSAHGYIWVDNTLTTVIGTPSTITALTNAFENAWTSDTTRYASPNYPMTAGGLQTMYSTCDSNGNTVSGAASPGYIFNTDQRIVVFIVNPASLGSGVGGYFDSTNFNPQAIANCFSPKGTVRSNEAPMIYVGWFGPQAPPPTNTLNYTLQEDVVRGTAHELQHLISFVNHVILSSNPQAVSEDTWLNEGMSMLAQDFAVNLMFPSTPSDLADAGRRGISYLNNPQNVSIPGFIGIVSGNLTFNCSTCYGAEYLFQRYLRDRFGGDSYTQNMDRAGSATSIANLATVTGQPASQLLLDFAIAIQNGGTGNSTAAQYNIPTLNLRGSSTDQLGTVWTWPAPGTVATLQPGVQATYNNYLGANFYVNVSGLTAGSSVKLNDSTGTYNVNGGIWQK